MDHSENLLEPLVEIGSTRGVQNSKTLLEKLERRQLGRALGMRGELQMGIRCGEPMYLSGSLVLKRQNNINKDLITSTATSNALTMTIPGKIHTHT